MPHTVAKWRTPAGPTSSCSSRNSRRAAEVRAAVDGWYPAALDVFGSSTSTRSETYIRWGLKRRTNAEARRQHAAEAAAVIADLGLQVPAVSTTRHAA